MLIKIHYHKNTCCNLQQIVNEPSQLANSHSQACDALMSHFYPWILTLLLLLKEQHLKRGEIVMVILSNFTADGNTSNLGQTRCFSSLFTLLSQSSLNQSNFSEKKASKTTLILDSTKQRSSQLPLNSRNKHTRAHSQRDIQGQIC